MSFSPKDPVMTRVCLKVIAIFLLASQLSRADFVVAPEGDDQHPGTAQKPFATIQRAQAAARIRIANGLTRDLVIEIRNGRYILDEPLVFDQRDSGTSQHRVVYAAAAGHTPRISGGQKISNWKLMADGSFAASLADRRFRELFVGGERRQRARHPNTGFLRVETVGADRRTRFTAQPGDLEALGDLAGAEFVFLHDWCISRIPIKSMDRATRNVTTEFSVGYAQPHGEMNRFEPHPRYAIENHSAAWDTPGEWYLDEGLGRIRYLPLSGETPKTLEAIVPVANRLVEVRGPAHSAARICNLHFRGLSFEHCGWFPPARGYASAQATWHERRDGLKGGLNPILSAVTLDGVENCSFTACRFAQLGGSGLWLRDNCHDNKIKGNHFVDISGNGLMLGKGGKLSKEHATAGNHITNNLIERCGQQYFGAVAIWVGLARSTRVAHNVIRHHPYTGISLGWSWNANRTTAQENVVAHNRIHHVMQILSDGGGIYTLGHQPDSFLQGNLIYDLPLNLGSAESNGIFMDEGSTGFTVENNLIHSVGRSPIRFHRATTNLVRDNILGTESGVEMFRYNATQADKIIKQDNRQIHDSLPPSAADFKRVAGAGLEPKFEKLLRKAEQDK